MAAPRDTFDILTDVAFDNVVSNFIRLNPIVDKATKKAIKDEAHYFRDKVGLAFETGGPPGHKWKPLSEWTIKKKKSSKILIETGFLREVVVKNGPYDAGKDAYFVGVPYGVYDKRGTEMVIWARVHENGAGKFFSSRSEGILIQGSAFDHDSDGVFIPRRSFLAWTWDHYYPSDHIVEERVSNRIRDHVVKNMGWLRTHVTKPGSPSLIKNL